MRGSAITAQLPAATYNFVDNTNGDFETSDIVIITTQLTLLTSAASAQRHERATFVERLKHAKRSGTGSVCVAWCDVAEPAQDTLTYLNETCFEEEYTLLVGFSLNEVATYILALRSGKRLADGARSRSRQASGLAALQDGLTMTSVLNDLDVVRLSKVLRTPNDVLCAEEAQFQQHLPGCGPKKAKKIARIFAAEFPTKRLRVDDPVLVSTQSGAVPAAAAAAASHRPVRRVETEGVAAALLRRRDDDDDDDESATPMALSWLSKLPGHGADDA
jgi:hypothetical protein